MPSRGDPAKENIYRYLQGVTHDSAIKLDNNSTLQPQLYTSATVQLSRIGVRMNSCTPHAQDNKIFNPSRKRFMMGRVWRQDLHLAHLLQVWQQLIFRMLHISYGAGQELGNECVELPQGSTLNELP